MKKILTAKAGVTILEGMIALGLLALVAAGAFGVLLSASRQNTQPDIREEMAWAVEKAYNQLQAYTAPNNLLPDEVSSTSHDSGLCNDQYPLRKVVHSISCMLPPICDPNNSYFTYKVEGVDVTLPEQKEEDFDDSMYRITFDIECNGYKL